MNLDILINKDNCDSPSGYLSVVSLSMHGSNQGFSTIRELTLSQSPDICLIQEHWLTPDNLLKFDKYFLTIHTSAHLLCLTLLLLAFFEADHSAVRHLFIKRTSSHSILYYLCGTL